MAVYNASGLPNSSDALSLSRAVATHPITEKLVAMALVRYLLPVIILTGTIGNVLSFIVLMRKRMRNTSVNFYLALLSCADTAVLYLSGFKTWLRVITGFEMLHVSNAGCKIIMFLFLVVLHLSAWLVVLVNFDRFIVVWFPFRAASFCSFRRSRMMAMATCLLILVYNVHVFWTFSLHTLPQGKQCIPLAENEFMNGAYNYVKMSSYAIVPFICVLLMDIAIIVKIYQHSGHLSRLGHGVMSSPLGDRIKKNKQQVTFMLLLVSVTWLCLTTPFTVISMIPFSHSNPLSIARAFLAKAICFLLMYTNHSLNFFLYCIATKTFRNELTSMFADLELLPCSHWRPTDRQPSRNKSNRSRSKRRKNSLPAKFGSDERLKEIPGSRQDKPQGPPPRASSQRDKSPDQAD